MFPLIPVSRLILIYFMTIKILIFIAQPIRNFQLFILNNYLVQTFRRLLLADRRLVCDSANTYKKAK